MVMFKDDEARLIAAERAAEPRWKKRLRLTLKILFVLMLIFGGSLTLLSMQSGDSDNLKRGLEEYMTRTTHMQARIGQFKYMSFFPVTGVDMADVTLTRDGVEAISAGHITVAMGFWDILFARAKFRTFDLGDVVIQPGVLDERRIQIKSWKLDKVGLNGKPAMILKGQYGDEAMTAALQFDLKPSAYVMPKKAAFDMALGPLQFSGVFSHAFAKGIRLDADKIGVRDHAATGSITFAKRGQAPELSFDLRYADSAVKGNIARKQQAGFSGVISIPALQLSNVAPLLAIVQTVALRWPDFLDQPPPSFTLDIAGIHEKDKNLGHLKADLAWSGATMHVTGVEDTLDKNALKLPRSPGGSIDIAAEGLDLSLPGGKIDCIVLPLLLQDTRIVSDSALLKGGEAVWKGKGSVQSAPPAVALRFTAQAKQDADICKAP